MTKNQKLATVFIAVPLSMLLTLSLTKKLNLWSFLAVFPIGFAVGVFADACAVRADEEYGQDQD
jgi:hypothetical protein